MYNLPLTFEQRKLKHEPKANFLNLARTLMAITNRIKTDLLRQFKIVKILVDYMDNGFNSFNFRVLVI